MTAKRPIKIYRSRDRRLKHGNFGDEITIPLIEKLFGLEALPSPMPAAELLGAGSILDSWIRSRRRFVSPFLVRPARELHVWGAGLMNPRRPKWPQRLEVHAVRGKLTAKQLGVDTVLGDPGILASLLLDEREPKRFAVGIVPHFVDVDVVRKGYQIPTNWRIIDPARPVDQVLAEIDSCELIMSSSLHGLITADSLGTPCVWLSTCNPIAGRSDFKFRDHETARAQPFNEPISYGQAANMNVDEIAAIATRPGRLVDEWQKELVAVFPFR